METFRALKLVGISEEFYYYHYYCCYCYLEGCIYLPVRYLLGQRHDYMHFEILAYFHAGPTLRICPSAFLF